MKKQRDKGQMDTFDCEGYLTIWAAENQDQYFIRYAHNDLHLKYKCIDLPEDVKQLVDGNLELRVTEIWKKILAVYPQPMFTRQQIYNRWLLKTNSKWRLDDNEVKSAKMLLEALRNSKEGYVEPIVFPEDNDGYTAFGFALPSLIRRWGGAIVEVALDSTFKTNKAGYECFALLGEVYGSGLPLGFLLIRSNDPSPGEKEKYIRSLIRDITSKWKITPIQSLSDKDITEINTFLAELPDDIKHQLCFWHGIRAVRGRLSVIGRPPAFYHAEEAFQEFDFIDRDFVPLAQMDPAKRTPENLQVAQVMLPMLKVRLNGSAISTAPKLPKIVIQVDGKLREFLGSLDSLEESDIVDVVDEEEEYAEHLIRENAHMVNQAEAEPSWIEPGEKPIGTSFRVSDDYEFCRPPHRSQLLHTFIRHGCLHPLLPERHGERRNKDQIRRDCVFEMYTFCKQRGLREVWGYMWEAWYCPAKWRLWARSSQPNFIGRWRTTMSVENFWKNLKHGTLHHFLHPRLDQLVYLIVTDIVPTFEASMLKFDPNWRLGRSKKLAPWQSAFKSEWAKLSRRELDSNADSYTTDISTWTCTCGQQKYNAFLLCKHLVQSVESPDPRFFREVYRRRVTPFYHHALLKPKDGSSVDDSHFSPSRLAGDLTPEQLYLPQAKELAVSEQSRKRNFSNTQTDESAERQLTDSEDDPVAASSSPTRSQSAVHPDEDFDDSDELEDHTRKLIQDLRRGADILEGQLSQLSESKILLRNVKRRKLGRDVTHFVQDIRHSHETGRVRKTVWGQNGGKAARRYTNNTLGSSQPS
ncbi:unnamed protein product [Mycena citricolor]|uniref:SWIM-type domain-containing protein n=1 Tax=Mycena citricolor TaxID=2018698 RepID=A0AAD2GVK4_9AGAR|nr:unnamed protein product [Mycena citricolor]